MPIYTFKCPKCKTEYEAIVNINQEYDKCPKCKSVTKRTHCDLPNPAQIEVGVGGVHRPKFGERRF